MAVDKVVGIGASAGGLTPLMEVIKNLPARLPAAVLVVLHLKNDKEPTKLPEIIGRETVLPVCLAKDNMRLEAGCIYIAQPGKHLLTKNRQLCLGIGQPVSHVRPSIDVLFKSVSVDFGENSIGVILSGGGSDGAQGCLEIQKHGGKTIVQNKETAAFFYMPEAAINTQVIDHVLPVNKIADKIVEIFM